MPWIAAAAAAAQLAGGAMGAAERGKAHDQVMAQIQASINDLNAIGIPPEEAQRLVLEEYRSAGKLTPELEQSVLQGRSEMEGISTDPRQREAQMQALSELQDIGQGGVRLSDKATEQKLMGDIEARSRGAREATTQQFRERGQYGSGAELAAQLANQQDAATNANQVGLNLNAQAQDRALQAIMEGGKLGGSMREQEFGEKSKIAAANDAINRFNADNSQGVVQRNIAAMNAAKSANLSNEQNIMNSNVDSRNFQQQFNKDLANKTYQKQLELANAKGNVRTGAANEISKHGAEQAAMWTGMGKGAGEAASSFGAKGVATPMGPQSGAKPVNLMADYEEEEKETV